VGLRRDTPELTSDALDVEALRKRRVEQCPNVIDELAARIGGIVAQRPDGETGLDASGRYHPVHQVGMIAGKLAHTTGAVKARQTRCQSRPPSTSINGWGYVLLSIGMTAGARDSPAKRAR
jgi:hypothetical protein